MFADIDDRRAGLSAPVSARGLTADWTLPPLAVASPDKINGSGAGHAGACRAEQRVAGPPESPVVVRVCGCVWVVHVIT